MSGWTDSQTIQDVTFAEFRAPGMLPVSPCARCEQAGLKSGGLKLGGTAGVTFLGEGVAVGFFDGGDGIILDTDGSLSGISGVNVFILYCHIMPAGSGLTRAKKTIK
jgi:hypothetical protein